jgi:hypothetical protein
MSYLKRKALRALIKVSDLNILERKGDTYHLGSDGKVHKNPDSLFLDNLRYMRQRGKRRIELDAQGTEPSIHVMKTRIPGTVRFGSFVLVAGLPYAQQKASALLLFKRVIRKLRAKGVKRIVTDLTIIPPRIASQIGFRLVKQIKLTKKGRRPFSVYRYEMEIGEEKKN